VECPNCSIEDLGNSLGQSLGLITNDDGSDVAQFDLVTYSMGGLIARAYLSGLQFDGSLASPLNPHIRKLVEIATPNLGSFIAATSGPLAPR
jgi:triacylglycerol esterase/lipase EstA (alpha/beta hydrolase family)